MPQAVAITRAVSPALAECELTYQTRVPIDVAVARAQHHAYEQALTAAGYRVEHLETDSTMPDSVFVEDMAIVFDELAILTRPGAESRRRETPAIAAALAAYRPLHEIQPPAAANALRLADRIVFAQAFPRTVDRLVALGLRVDLVDASELAKAEGAVTSAPRTSCRAFNSTRRN